MAVVESAHPVVMLIIEVGAVAAAITTMFALIERVWGPMKKWLQNALTTPLILELERVREIVKTQHEYVSYHLGPNGDITPLHHRVSTLEWQMRRICEEGKPGEERKPGGEPGGEPDVGRPVG